MTYLALPIGSFYGWAICGKNLGKELLQLTPIQYLPFENYNKGASAFDRVAYGELSIDTPRVAGAVIQAAEPGIVPFPCLVDAHPKIGLTFAAYLSPQNEIKAWARYWDFLVAGSKWCQQLLAEQGISSTVIHQGIDPLLFNDGYATKQLLKNHFVVFSGGKWEYRKGHDLVIKAYKIFQDKYKDAFLLAAWFNAWPGSMSDMAQSRHIRFTATQTDWAGILRHTLVENGIDMSRVLVLGVMDNSAVGNVYRNSDVGLFPNRGEAGTNLVLMEYMACGKPALVSYCAGHIDIVNEENAILLRDIATHPVYWQGQFRGVWGEPSVSEIVDRLDWAYHNRDKTALIGKKAAESMKATTWRRMADNVLKLIKELEK